METGIFLEPSGFPDVPASAAGRAVTIASPFSHAVVEDFFAPDVCERVLEWLEETDRWRERVAEEFYTIEELVVTPDELPAELSFLLDAAFLAMLRRQMRGFFGVSFDEITTLRMHKLANGCRIRVHTDFGTEPDTHRLVVHLNRGWDAERGGILMFLDADHLEELHETHRYYVPAPGLAVGFEISEHSYHAVTEVLAGERYTLCYSFRRVPEESAD
jgi:Rps23 Pro-64 3,4-dihydroxylase Tpa1-like proline 4-hydroxylase